VPDYLELVICGCKTCPYTVLHLLSSLPPSLRYCVCLYRVASIDRPYWM